MSREKPPLRFVVPTEAAGLRIDQAIALLTAHSRTSARRLLERGSVFIDKKRVKVASRTVFVGQRVEVHDSELARASEVSPGPEQIPVVYASSSVLVVDKPSGVFAAPTPETDQHDLLHFLRPEFGELLLVHRLDRPTSGLMMLARTKAAAAVLGRALAERTAHRTYRALLGGVLTHDGAGAKEFVAVEGKHLVCRAPLEGQPATTRFEVVQHHGLITEVTVTLETGRTHQIRLHAEFLDHPVLGDSKYGRRAARGLPRPPRLCLHAEALEFPDPDSGATLSFRSTFPAELREFVQTVTADGALDASGLDPEARER